MFGFTVFDTIVAKVCCKYREKSLIASSQISLGLALWSAAGCVFSLNKEFDAYLKSVTHI